MPCRVNRQRVWYHRILLEGMCHERSSFLTLTYSEEALPSDGSVRPAVLSGFVKRLRKHLYGSSPGGLRYFGVGEYGDKSFRPHYHFILFGEACSSFGIGGNCQCRMCTAVRKSWDIGWFSISPLTLERAKYIAKYTLKKMTSFVDPRLSGRQPEFARMSLKPGLGANAMWDVASVMLRYQLNLPTALKHGRKPLPLGRYLRKKLASYADVEIPAYSDEKLSMVRAFAFANSRSVRSVYQALFTPYEAALLNEVRRKNEKVKI